MNNAEILDRCEQATMRIGGVLHIGGMIADGGASSALEDFVNDAFDSYVQSELAEQLPWLKRFDMPTVEDFTMGAVDNRTLGFLVKGERPVIDVKDVSADGNGFRCSWGCYQSRWFYGETFADAVLLAEKWAKDCIADVKAKAAALQATANG